MGIHEGRGSGRGGELERRGKLGGGKGIPGADGAHWPLFFHLGQDGPSHHALRSNLRQFFEQERRGGEVNGDVLGDSDYFFGFGMTDFFSGAFLFGESAKAAEVNTFAPFKAFGGFGQDKLNNFFGFDFCEKKLLGYRVGNGFLVHAFFDFWM